MFVCLSMITRSIWHIKWYWTTI